MQEPVYKDYYIINGKLIKFKMTEGKHLLWKYGGVPAIDKELWDKHKDEITGIHFRTKKRTFKCSKEKFDYYKKEIDFGYRPQYIIDKENWNIIENIKQ